MPSVKTYKLRREQGVCTHCGGAKDEGHTTCKACREIINAKRRKLVAEYQAMGHCACGRPLYSTKNRYCEICIAYNSEYRNKRRENMNAEEKERERKRNTELKNNEYHRRKENGLCVRCGEKLDQDGVRCSRCAAWFAEYQRQRKERLGLVTHIQQTRRDNGLCMYCGKPNLKPHKLCAEHYIIWREYGKSSPTAGMNKPVLLKRSV